MNATRYFALTLIAVSFLATSSAAEEHEKKIQRSDLPPAVETTVASQSQGATIHSFNEEQENGKTYYEAEMTLNGHSKDVLIEPSGAIAEVEEQVDFVSLPAAVQSGLQKRAGKGKLGKVESITKHDKLVAYEAKVTTNGKKSEVQVGPNGEALDDEDSRSTSTFILWAESTRSLFALLEVHANLAKKTGLYLNNSLLDWLTLGGSPDELCPRPQNISLLSFCSSSSVRA